LRNRQEAPMHSVLFGEFMGTLVLILLGNGVNAGVTLRKSYAADSGWMAITTGWALAVLCGVLVAQAFGSPGAHLNPAITLAAAVVSGNYSQVISMWSAQLLGAMSGAALMTLQYAPHWRLTPDPAAKLGVFCTNAAVRSPLCNIFSEVLGTAVLIVVAGSIFSRGVSAAGPAAGLSAGIGPWLVGSLVWGIGLSLGGTTGYAINPARDLGPRLVH
jgi:glycerol uptake facilitator protein